MYKILSFSFYLFLSIVSYSQAPVLYALTKAEASFPFKTYSSTISKYDVGSNSIESVYTFQNDGLTPIGTMKQAPNGKLYGLKTGTNMEGSGIIFSFDPLSSTYEKVAVFDGSNGSFPTGDLVLYGNKFFGLTSAGGTNNVGVIYSFDISTSAITKLFDFSSEYGKGQGDLSLAHNGVLYGTREDGGLNDYGLLFSFNPLTLTYKKLFDFNLPGGASPVGAPILVGSKLYGVTSLGGNGFGSNIPKGVIYSFDILSNTYQVHHNFGLTRPGEFPPKFNGAGPVGGLMQANDGKLYGLTEFGGEPSMIYNAGVAYSFDPSTNTFVVNGLLYYLTPLPPVGKLFQASNGTIYGTRQSGFPNRVGAIFSFETNDSFVRVNDKINNFRIFFTGDNGGYPTGGVVEYKVCSDPPIATIPDSKSLPQGVEVNTVYKGYAPASAITLTAQSVGGSSSYSYKWSNGSTSQSITVSSVENTTYSVTVADSRGCTNTVTKEIKVVDVRCGNNNDKVIVCKGDGKKSKENVLCIGTGAVAAHLAKGGSLGNCGGNVEAIEEAKTLQINASPNPTSSSFTLSITTRNSKEKIQLNIYNSLGRVIETRKLNGNQTLQLGSSYLPDIYFIEAIQGEQKVSIKVIKTR